MHVGAAADAGRDVPAASGLRPVDVALLGATHASVTIWVENPGPPVAPRPTEPGKAISRNGCGIWFFLTRSLHANRFPLRLRTLEAPHAGANGAGEPRRDLGAAGVEGGRVRRLDRHVDDRAAGSGIAALSRAARLCWSIPATRGAW
jgi:hypothetical protein